MCPKSPNFVTDAQAAHLGGNIREGDAFSFCPNVWTYVIERFSISSVMDLGSGTGDAARFFFRRGLMTVAIEGLASNVVHSSYPTVLHDLVKGPVFTRVDLVHCQEVVEHIDQKCLPNLIASLRCGRVVLMTHAVPGQEGYHHVNLQPAQYWIRHVTAEGYSYLAEDTSRIRAIAKAEGAQYMAQSGLLFYRTSD
jgi:hypothetical protein